jgi:hypothetical protein
MEPKRHPGWRRVLKAVLLLFVATAVLLGASVLYLNFAGVPDVLKHRLLAELRQHGVDMEFRRMKLRGIRGIAADEVRIRSLNGTNGPVITAARSTCAWAPALSGTQRFRLRSMTLRDAEVRWQGSETTTPPLRIDHLRARVEILPSGEWFIPSLRAQWNGAELDLQLRLTNPAAIRAWPIWRRPKRDDEPMPGLSWVDALARIEFGEPSTISLQLTGDARRLESLEAQFELRAPGAISTPWADGANLRVMIHAARPFSRDGAASAHLQLDSFRAAQGRGDAIQVQTSCVFGDGIDQPVNATSFLTASRLECERTAETNQLFASRGLVLDARTSHSLTNRWPLFGQASIRSASVETPWGQSSRMELSFDGALLEEAGFPPGEELGFWRRLERLSGNWSGTAREIRSPKLRMDAAELTGAWRPPLITLEKLDAALYGGKLIAKGQLDVLTRLAQVDASGDFDAHHLSPLLTTNGRRWLSQFTWDQPPVTAAQIQAILPEWTERQPDWRNEVLPTMSMRGHFLSGAGGFRDVPVLSARSSFVYSNQIWNLPDLEAIRPEGNFQLRYSANERTREYHFDITSQVDPLAARPLVPEEEGQKAFEYFEFLSPPLIRAEIWGRWVDHDSIGARGEILATNFIFRGTHVDYFSGSIQFTNLFLTLTQARVERGGQSIDAPRVEFDIHNQLIWLTDVVSTMEPELVTRAIGPVIAEAVEPYRFLLPPLVKVHGKFSTKEVDLADLTFLVEGEQFHWGPFSAEHASGVVRWTGQSLGLTNLTAGAYFGQLTGSALFDFSPEKGADLAFTVHLRDVDLQTAVIGLGLSTNRLEGLLDGTVSIFSGNTLDLRTWQGRGELNLRDGFMWEIPMFGIFSSPLDSIMPGLGKSPVGHASASFLLANGIASSHDLELRAPALRMQYRGQIDLDYQIDARVEAEILRDTWMIGRWVSLALFPLTKLFEYRVTGPLSAPKSEPVYIPRVLMFPLRPFQTLREMFPEPEPSSPTVRE